MSGAGPRLAGLLLSLLAPCAGAVARAGDLPDLVARFRRDAKGTDPAERLRAYDRVADEADPRLVGAILDASALHRRELADARVRLAADAAAFVEAGRALERVRVATDRTRPFDAEATRLAKELDRLRARRADLEDELARRRVVVGRLERVLERARDGMARLLARLADEAFPAALARTVTGWSRAPGSGPEDGIRLVDAIERLRREGVSEALAAVVRDPAADPRVRTIALRARAERRDEGTRDEAAAFLAEPGWILVAGGIDALRTLHARECIPPLIGALGRERLGRIREDLRRALCALTGEAFGPYREPWAAWWADAGKDFELPRRPAPVPPLGGTGTTTSFHGITTLSDRVLYLLDVSGSMDEPDRRSRGGLRRIDLARAELASSLGTLDAGGRFGVVLFQEGVLVPPGGVQPTDDATRARVRAFVAGVEPSGPTNLADALEEAYRLAATGAIDTVFLLTDGRPSAGEPVTPDGILELVARRARGLPVVIHAVGLGDHDADLLARLADRTGGRYVAR